LGKGKLPFVGDMHKNATRCSKRTVRDKRKGKRGKKGPSSEAGCPKGKGGQTIAVDYGKGRDAVEAFVPN